MNTIAAFDLETTGTDIGTAEVVQAAVLLQRGDDQAEEHCALFRSARPIPPGASAVHGITDAMVADRPLFAEVAADMAAALESADTLITYNGGAYDVPILERYIGRHLDHPCHVDVWRLWERARAAGMRRSDRAKTPASLFTGSLGSAHWWAVGDELTGAHDAMVDVRGTVAVATSLRLEFGVSWAGAAELCNQPLPGFADLGGKLKWRGGDLTIDFGKHRGALLREVDRSYLRWLLNQDFPADTQAIVRDALAGRYPTPPKAAQ